MKKNWGVTQLWNGGTAFVIGGGPSLMLQAGLPLHEKDPKIVFPAIRKYLLSLGLDKYRVIGVNNAFELGDDLVDVMWFSDPGWFEHNFIELAKYAGLKIHCCTRHSERPGTIRVLRKEINGISINPQIIHWNKSSGASAINLAYLLGARKVVLIAFDMKFAGDKINNWHDRHKHRERQKPGNFRNWEPHKRHITVFKYIKRDADMLGLKIINANPDSEITEFPKMKLEDAIHAVESPEAMAR